MPAVHAWSNTGIITIAVRNSDSASSTWLDGVCPVPSAWRSRPSTIVMRVNAVMPSNAAGSSVMPVISSSTCSGMLTGWLPIEPTFTAAGRPVPRRPRRGLRECIAGEGEQAE